MILLAFLMKMIAERGIDFFLYLILGFPTVDSANLSHLIKGIIIDHSPLAISFFLLFFLFYIVFIVIFFARTNLASASTQGVGYTPPRAAPSQAG